jgi:hypothetical protein
MRSELVFGAMTYISNRYLHLNDGEEFERFLRKNSEKFRFADWLTSYGSES